MEAAPQVFTVDRRRGSLMFATVIGCGLIAASIVTYCLHFAYSRSIAGDSRLGVMGALAVAYIQGIYPAVTRLVLWPDRIELRGLLGVRSVAWEKVATLTSVSALEPATRGGNIGGIRIRDRAGASLMMVPDVFHVRRNTLLPMLRSYRTESFARAKGKEPD